MSLEFKNLFRFFRESNNNFFMTIESPYLSLFNYLDDPVNIEIKVIKKLYGENFDKIDKISFQNNNQSINTNLCIKSSSLIRRDYISNEYVDRIPLLLSYNTTSYYFEIINGILQYYNKVPLFFQDGFIYNNALYTYNITGLNGITFKKPNIYLTKSYIESNFTSLSNYSLNQIFNISTKSYQIINNKYYINDDYIEYNLLINILDSNSGSFNNGIYNSSIINITNDPISILGQTISFPSKGKLITVINTINISSVDITKNISEITNEIDNLVFNYYGRYENNNLYYSLVDLVNDYKRDKNYVYLYNNFINNNCIQYELNSNSINQTNITLSMVFNSLSNNLNNTINLVCTQGISPIDQSNFTNSIHGMLYATYEYDKKGIILNGIETIYTYNTGKINEEINSIVNSINSRTDIRNTTELNNEFGLILNKNAIIPTTITTDITYPTISQGFLMINDLNKNLIINDPELNLTSFQTQNSNVLINLEISHIIKNYFYDSNYYIFTINNSDINLEEINGNFESKEKYFYTIKTTNISNIIDYSSKYKEKKVYI